MLRKCLGLSIFHIEGSCSCFCNCRNDETSNIYKSYTDEYKKLTTGAVTSTYKKVPDKINDKINTEGAKPHQTERLLVVKTIASSPRKTIKKIF